MKSLNELNREELYELVWSEAMLTLAPKFGISDVGLKKRCAVRGVPTPPRGYWAKIEAGKAVHKTKLPPEIPPRAKKANEPKYADEMVYFTVDGAEYSISKPDPITTATRNFYSTRYASTTDSRDGRARLAVSSKSLKRALWLLDSLVKEARRIGMTVEARGGYESGVRFLAFGEYCDVEIREKSRRFNRREYVPNRQVRWPETNDPYEFRECGLLKIKAKYSVYSDGEWVDSVSKPLDDAIEETAAAILQGLKACAERREGWRQAEIRRQEEDRRAELRRRADEAEQKRREELEHFAQSLTLSAQIINLADQVEAKVRSLRIDPNADELISTWLTWAREHADRLDPIKIITHRILKTSPR